MKFRPLSILVGMMACFAIVACSSDDDPSSCGFQAGIYDITSINFHGDTGVCIAAAEDLNKSSANKGSVFTITKVDEATFEVNGANDTDAARSYKVDGATCELRATFTESGDGTDTSGKPIKVSRAVTNTLKSTGADTITLTVVREISTETSGATGLPCTFSGSAAGTRRR